MKRFKIIRTIKWVLIAILSPIVILYLISVYCVYQDRPSENNTVMNSEEISVDFGVPATIDNIDSCFRGLISKRIELYMSDRTDLIKIDSVVCEPLENHIYFDKHKELKVIDFRTVDSLINISSNDTVYVASTYFMDLDSVYVYIASYSSARTFKYLVNKQTNEVVSYNNISKIPGKVYNIGHTVSKDFTTTAWGLTLGAKMTVKDDTIRLGTVYFHTFIVK